MARRVIDALNAALSSSFAAWRLGSGGPRSNQMPIPQQARFSCPHPFEVVVAARTTGLILHQLRCGAETSAYALTNQLGVRPPIGGCVRTTRNLATKTQIAASADCRGEPMVGLPTDEWVAPTTRIIPSAAVQITKL